MEVEWNTARVDLSLMLEECGEQFLAAWNTALTYSRPPASRRFIGHYVSFLRAATARPDAPALEVSIA